MQNQRMEPVQIFLFTWGSVLLPHPVSTFVLFIFCDCVERVLPKARWNVLNANGRDPPAGWGESVADQGGIPSRYGSQRNHEAEFDPRIERLSLHGASPPKL